MINTKLKSGAQGQPGNMVGSDIASATNTLAIYANNRATRLALSVKQAAHFRIAGLLDKKPKLRTTDPTGFTKPTRLGQIVINEGVTGWVSFGYGLNDWRVL